MKTAYCAYVFLGKLVEVVPLASVASFMLDAIHLVVGRGSPAEMCFCYAPFVALAAIVSGMMLSGRRRAVSKLTDVSCGSVSDAIFPELSIPLR